MKISNNPKYNVTNEYRGGGADFGDTYFYVVPERVAEAISNKDLDFLQVLVIYAVTNIYDSSKDKLYPKEGESYALVTNITRFTNDSVLNLVKTEADVGHMYRLLDGLLDLGSEYITSGEVIKSKEDFNASSASDFLLDYLDDDESRKEVFELLAELGYADLVNDIKAGLREFEEADDDE